MEELNADQQDFVDELLWGNSWLCAIQFYKAVSECGLIQAKNAIDDRMQQIGLDFDGESLARMEAFARLYAVKEPVIVVEESWDGDSHGWFIRLAAITQTPSQSHPKYTEYGLCFVRGYGNQVENAEALGRELAEVAEAPFYLTSATVDDTARWWDLQPD